MTDQHGWGPPQQPPWEQTQQPPPPGYPSGPGHQAPRPRKRHRVRNTILGLGGAVVLVVIIAVAAGSHNGVTKAPAASTGTKAPPSPAATAQAAGNSTTGPVGTTFLVTDTNQNGATVKYSVTLDKVIQHAQPDNSFDTAPAGDHLAGAEFTIRGISGTDSDDVNNDAAAIGTDQQTYQTGLEGLAAGTNFDSGDFSTSPGSVSVGWVSFEVKDGVHVASVQWNPDSDMSGEAPGTWTAG